MIVPMTEPSRTAKLPPDVQRALNTLSYDTAEASNFTDIKRIYNIRDERYAPVIALAQKGNTSAIRLLEMMQATYSQANLPDYPGKAHRGGFQELHEDLTRVFAPQNGLIGRLAQVEAVVKNTNKEPTKEAPIINGGALASAIKSLEVTLRQISQEGKSGGGAQNARLLKGRIITPILVAGLGQKAVEELMAEHYGESANAASQAILIAATQAGLFKSGVKAISGFAKERGAQQLLDLANEKVAAYIGIQKTLTIAGRDIPILGIFVSETGTLIGVAGRLANGDYVGAAGTFVAGSAGNIAAELIPIPGLDLAGGETVEELAAMGINSAFDPKVPVKGSTLLAASKKVIDIFQSQPLRGPLPPIHQDAEGKLIFQASDILQAPMPVDATRVALRLALPVSQAQLPLITKNEQAYLDSVSRKLKGDTELGNIISMLTSVFQSTTGNDQFKEGDVLDKKLESRLVKTKTWTHY